MAKEAGVRDVFTQAVGESIPRQLYFAVKKELFREYPELQRNFALFFDNDPRSVTDVIKEDYKNAPENGEFLLSFLDGQKDFIDAGISVSATAARQENDEVYPVIILFDVVNTINARKMERAMWDRDHDRLPLSNPPIRFPEQFVFWRDFYHELGNFLHVRQKLQSYKDGNVPPAEKECFADIFAALCSVKRMGKACVPHLLYNADVDCLMNVGGTTLSYFSTPYIRDTMAEVMLGRIDPTKMSFRQIEDKAQEIYDRISATRPDIARYESTDLNAFIDNNHADIMWAMRSSGLASAEKFDTLVNGMRKMKLDNPDIADKIHYMEPLCMVAPREAEGVLALAGFGSIAIEYKTSIYGVTSLANGLDPYKVPGADIKRYPPMRSDPS